MATARKDVASVIAARLQKRQNQRELARQIAAFLIAERRSGDLEPLMRDVMAVRYQQTGVLEAAVTSAFPLTPVAKQQITTILPTDNLVINEIIDPAVIGGVRIEAGSTLIDATIQRQLETIKQGASTK